MINLIIIISTAGAVANIVDVVCKTVKTLRELHDKWKDADLNLITQLTQ